jgi:hypothetical protein
LLLVALTPLGKLVDSVNKAIHFLLAFDMQYRQDILQCFFGIFVGLGGTVETWIELLAGSVGIGEEDLPPPGTLCVASEFVNPGKFLGGAGCCGEERKLEA